MTTITKKTYKKTAPKANPKKLKPLNFLGLFIAGIVNAIGVTIFLSPVSLYDSGISGTSMFLGQITPEWLPLSFFLIVLNFPIFLFGLKKQGWVFTVYSLFAITVYSGTAFLITNVLKLGIDSLSPLAGDDLLLCAIFGGLISGLGSGLTIKFGGAMDGIEVLSVVFSKKLGLSIGTFVMIFNFVLYVVCGAVMKEWTLPLYSIVTYFVGSKTVDFVVEGFNRSKCAMVITTKAEELTTVYSENFTTGGTVVEAIGGSSGISRNIIYVIVNNFQLYKLEELTHEVDPEAFISIQDVTDIIKKKVKAADKTVSK